MNINPLDAPGVPFVIELLNPNPSSRRTKDGPVYRVSFEISKEDHDTFMASRASNLRIIGKMSVLPDTDEQPAHDAVNGTTPEKPKREKKQKEPKGPFGAMWEYLHPYGKHEGRGFVTLPGVKEAIEEDRIAETEDVWAILHRVFDHVVTLAVIGPDQVLERFPNNAPVQIAVERAMKFQRDKETKQCQPQ